MYHIGMVIVRTKHAMEMRNWRVLSLCTYMYGTLLCCFGIFQFFLKI
jgi:hypothetical protein